MTSALKIKESGLSGRRYTADGVQITSRQSVYDLDEIGNRVTSSTPGYVLYTVNDDNQYTVMRDVSLTYDPASNLLTNGSWTYSWDNENRLTQVVSTSKLIQFTYDTQGRRIEKKVWNNTTGTGTPATYLKYIYDGWNLIAELNGNSNNAKVRTYTWGLDASGSTQGAGGVGGLLMVDDASNGVHFVSYDPNGNIMGLVKATNGTVSASYEYGPFGELLVSTGTMSSSNPFRFSTKYRDTETDLYYYGYRYYSPSLGRWISRDPIEEQGGLNSYAFCENNGVNRWDKLGLFDWFWPFNSRICNNSSDQCLIVWNDKTGYSLLKAGECTSKWKDRGDFAYWNGSWYKCRGGHICSIDDRPISKYPNSKNYLPPVEEDQIINKWHPSPPSEDLCRKYCDCNSKSLHAIELRDHCDCLKKCLENY